jgi:YidC/Oxa1 family membrane protein insertase
MSSNQRLLLAVALSIVFFIGYSAIFPPKQTQAQKDIAQNYKENTLI